MLQVDFQEINYRGKGIVVWHQVEVQGAAHKLRQAIGKVKLVRRSSIRTFNIIDKSIYLMIRIKILALHDRICFRYMFIDEFPGILQVI